MIRACLYSGCMAILTDHANFLLTTYRREASAQHRPALHSVFGATEVILLCLIQICRAATLEAAPSSRVEGQAKNIETVVEEIAALTSPLHIMDKVIPPEVVLACLMHAHWEMSYS